jgi:hypothetical protein
VGARVVEEEVAVDSLSLEPALHVGEARQDRVDRSALHLVAELIDAQHPLDAGRSLGSDAVCHLPLLL